MYSNSDILFSGRLCSRPGQALVMNEPCLGDEVEDTAACYAGGHRILLAIQDA